MHYSGSECCVDGEYQKKMGKYIVYKKYAECIGVALLFTMVCTVAKSEVLNEKLLQNDMSNRNTTSNQPTNATNNYIESRFSAYKPNFAIIADSKNDELGLQVRLSAKYTFLDCSKKSNNGVSAFSCNPLGLGALDNLNVFFSYTTDFDFYVFSDGDGDLGRKSRPVRNRMTSPGLHFNWNRKLPANRSGMWWSGAMVSIIHHSNGQDIEYETFFDETSTSQEITETITTLSENQPSWMDGVSRGWNFLELEGNFLLGNSFANCSRRISCTNIFASLKFPITEIDDDIWWEPGNESSYRDYNIFALRLATEWGVNNRSNSNLMEIGSKELSLELSCGDAGCSTNTWLRLDTYLGRGNFRIPLMFFAHIGPNEHFYNYHEKTNTFGLGFQFNP